MSGPLSTKSGKFWTMKTRIVLLAAAIAACSSWPASADGDPVKGAKVFRKCRACHAVEEVNKVGPHLSGIMGRPVASLQDYRYSDAMVEFGADGNVWDVETLTLYLHKPKALVDRTKMAFAGLKNDEDIENLLAYLADPSAADQ
jgi:cytochrome c